MAEITESVIITPLEETPKQKIWLSNLDLVASRGYTPIIYVYPNTTAQSDLFPTETVKTALAKALVIFYPLAGRLSRDPQTGRIEIDCNGEGVLFVTAQLDATVEDFKHFKPSKEMRKKLLPAAETVEPPCLLMMLQMTRLSCGGIILGLAAHHYTLDGRSFTSFIKAFSSFSQGDSTTTIPLPFFDRTLLRARLPPTICYDHSDYSDNSLKFFPSSSITPFMTANLKLSREQVHMLKVKSGGERFSTFRAVTAHVWKCVCIARGLAPDVEVQLLLPVDLRARLKPPLPTTYFGNPTIRTKAVAKVEEIMSHSLEFTANLITNAVERVTNEFVMSLMDHLESMNLEVLCKRGTMPNTSLVAVSWLSLPMYDADFGWGAPTLMARADMFGSGYVYLTRVPALNGGISVILGLEMDAMLSFKRIFYDGIEEFRMSSL